MDYDRRVSPSGFALRVALLTALGVGLRVIYTVTIAPWPPQSFDDEIFYWVRSGLIAGGHGFSDPAAALSGHFVPTASHPPLYPLVLAAVYLLGGHGSGHDRHSGRAGSTAGRGPGWSSCRRGRGRLSHVHHRRRRDAERIALRPPCGAVVAVCLPAARPARRRSWRPTGRDDRAGGARPRRGTAARASSPGADCPSSHTDAARLWRPAWRAWPC